MNGERHAAEIVVIDVGTRPAFPPVPGLADVPWLDNATMTEMRELPEHLLVLGGGYIGSEFGQAFRRFGAEVLIIDQADHLLPGEDPDASKSIEGAFRSDGVSLQLETRLDRIEEGKKGIELRLEGDSTLSGSHLLVAIGRQPNTDDLGCENAGIDLDERGFIRVDDSYGTSTPGVYATGDVTGGPQVTHASWDDHRLLYKLILGQGGRRRSARLIPRATFTDPQVAGVGLTERQAQKQGVSYEAASFSSGHIARAIETGETAGLLRLLIDLPPSASSARP